MSGKYHLLLAFWGGLFVASALIMFVSLQSFREERGNVLPPFPIAPPLAEIEDGAPTDKPGSEDVGDEDSTQWSLVLATVSAFISAAGFMTTTYFAMRSDRRQAALTELEVQKLANEIERQRLEIDQLRRSQQNQEKSQQG
jgi:hypothetical protein